MIKFIGNENINIPKKTAEKLLSIDPLCLRIYILAMLRRGVDLDGVTEQLGVKRTHVLQAFEKMEAEGILVFETGHESSTYRFADFEANYQPENYLYEDSDFNRHLQSLFTDRELRYHDLKLFYKMFEVYDLPKNVILVLAENCINSHPMKNRLPIRHIDAKAQVWSKEHIKTLDAAMDKIFDVGYEGLQSILHDDLGIRGRQPTSAEYELYNKWISEWGFSLGAIHEAAKQTAAIQQPNMKYLDAILHAIFVAGKRDLYSVREFISTRNDEDKRIKNLLHIFGKRQSVMPEHRLAYKKLTSLASPAEIEQCAKFLSAWGARNFPAIETLISEIKAEGENVTFGLEKLEASYAGAKLLLTAAGLGKMPSKPDAELYGKYAQSFSDEVLLFAAEGKKGLDRPMAALAKTLSSWEQRGVGTLDEAKSAQKTDKKRNDKTTFEQREYVRGEFEKKFFDPTAL